MMLWYKQIQNLKPDVRCRQRGEKRELSVNKEFTAQLEFSVGFWDDSETFSKVVRNFSGI